MYHKNIHLFTTRTVLLTLLVAAFVCLSTFPEVVHAGGGAGDGTGTGESAEESTTDPNAPNDAQFGGGSTDSPLPYGNPAESFGDTGFFDPPNPNPNPTPNPNPPVNPPTLGVTPSPAKEGSTVVATWQCDTARGDTSSAGIGFTTGGAAGGSSGPIMALAPSLLLGVRCFPSGMETVTNLSVVSPALSVRANPDRVRSGQTSTITWFASNVTSCTLKKNGSTIASCSSDAICRTTKTLSSGALTTQTNFVLACATLVGPETASAVVNITPSVCEAGTAACPE